MNGSDAVANPGSLQGVRIRLSGALSEAEQTDQSERRAILEFVGGFAANVFHLGGHIMHGAHPSFTPTLLYQAKNHQERGGKKDCLIFVLSRGWSQNRKQVPIDDW